MNLLPDGRLSMFPDCGHLPHVEQPARFAAVLGDWLTEHREQQTQSPPSTAAEPRYLGQGHLVSKPWQRTA